MTFLEKTLYLLQNRPRSQTYNEISTMTNIGESWLRMFGRGEIQDPSVNKIQTLYEFLSGEKLKF